MRLIRRIRRIRHVRHIGYIGHIRCIRRPRHVRHTGHVRHIRRMTHVRHIRRMTHVRHIRRMTHVRHIRRMTHVRHIRRMTHIRHIRRMTHVRHVRCIRVSLCIGDICGFQAINTDCVQSTRWELQNKNIGSPSDHSQWTTVGGLQGMAHTINAHPHMRTGGQISGYISGSSTGMMMSTGEGNKINVIHMLCQLTNVPFADWHPLNRTPGKK